MTLALSTVTLPLAPSNAAGSALAMPWSPFSRSCCASRKRAWSSSIEPGGSSPPADVTTACWFFAISFMSVWNWAAVCPCLRKLSSSFAPTRLACAVTALADST